LHNLLLNPHGAMDGIQRLGFSLLHSILGGLVLLNREYPYRTTGAIVFRIAYGYSLVEGKDPFLETFDLRANIFTRSTQPAAFLVNFLPLRMSCKIHYP
jgi:hypothetical protein